MMGWNSRQTNLAALCTPTLFVSLSLLRVSHLLVFRGIMQVSLIDHKWAEDESS